MSKNYSFSFDIKSGDFSKFSMVHKVSMVNLDRIVICLTKEKKVRRIVV
jgi:hypothetical protein